MIVFVTYKILLYCSSGNFLLHISGLKLIPEIIYLCRNQAMLVRYYQWCFNHLSILATSNNNFIQLILNWKASLMKKTFTRKRQYLYRWVGMWHLVSYIDRSLALIVNWLFSCMHLTVHFCVHHKHQACMLPSSLFSCRVSESALLAGL